MPVVIYSLVAVVGGFAGAVLAPLKKRSWASWFMVCLVFPGIGHIVLLALPDGDALQGSPASEIEKLSELHDKGIIDRDEFNEKKKILLDKIR